MKKAVIPILSVVFLASVYFFLWKFYPKNTGMFPGFVILYLLDIYLFWIYRENILRGSIFRRILLFSVFWIPMLMIIAMALISIVHPYNQWNQDVKTYYGGFILIGYVSKFIPLLMMLLSDFIKILHPELMKDHQLYFFKKLE